MSNFSRAISGGIETPRRTVSSTFFAPKANGWTSVSQLSGLIQIALGFVLFCASSSWLMHSVKLCGQLIGILSAVLGIVGILGLRFQRAAMQTLFIVSMGFVAMMTFEFIVQVGRDVDIHCNFAETYTRITHLEEKMMSLRQDDMMMQLYTRLNEMDDVLDMVQESAVEDIDTISKAQETMDRDVEYIGSKIQMLRHHADHVLEHLTKQGKRTEASAPSSDDTKLQTKQKEIQDDVKNKLENVQKVLEKLDEKDRKKDGFTYEEYEQLIQALAGSHNASESLRQEATHLPYLKAAWDRFSIGYGRDQKMEALMKHREEQRLLFEQTFHRSIDQNQRTGPSAFKATLTESLDDLPEHCLIENHHLGYFAFGGWMLIAAQMATAYVTATSLLITNVKKDF